MARWKGAAIGFGVAVQLLLVFGSLLAPPFAATAIAAAGGLVAGALAGGGPRPGARHGLAAGALGGLAVLLLGVPVELVLGLASVPPAAYVEWRPVAWLFDAVGGLGLVVLGSLTMPPIGAATGALGGAIRGEKTYPDRMENERRR